MSHSEMVVIIHDDGEATFPHVDWESSPITVWHRDEHKHRDPGSDTPLPHEYIVFKLPAGHHWASILEPRVPHPGRYLITEVVRPLESSGPDRERLLVRELLTMPLSARGKGNFR